MPQTVNLDTWRTKALIVGILLVELVLIVLPLILYP